jgi:hypothetical protein
MVVAAYPHDDAAEENPSILVSGDGQHWSVPAGISNPVQKPALGSHLADSSLFFDISSNELWLYYISEDQFGFTNVMRKTSADGLHWSTPQLVIRVPDYQIVMPTISKLDGRYWLWSVNAGHAGCSASSTSVQFRTSLDGVHWSAPEAVDIEQPGYHIWHISVTSIFLSSGPMLAMLESAYKVNCGGTDLFLALSNDGVHWQHFGMPILTPNVGHWDGEGIYESTMGFDLGTYLFTIWYSAWNESPAGPVWHVGQVQGSFPSMLQQLIDGP